ncbi:hypothetical protein EV129_10357 [Rhizobium azibense]|uniref:Uncharacterized protein n=1 Tax=Rhizobium azibense TaxID=1136135 RepID=A0A4R3RYD4_9HYPH|nr:hypothetical protein EV129_10357 [Rhizobium azibense]
MSAGKRKSDAASSSWAGFHLTSVPPTAAAHGQASLRPLCADVFLWQ